MKEVISQQCAKCKKERESLYLVDAYWTPAVQVQNLGGSVQTTYNLASKHIVQYRICKKCVERTMKFNKIFRYIIGSIFTVMAASLPVVYAIELIFGIDANSGVTEAWMPVLLFIAAVGIAGYTFYKRNPDEVRNKTIDDIVRNKLNNDIMFGKIAEAAILRKRNVRLYVWSELTKKQN